MYKQREQLFVQTFLAGLLIDISLLAHAIARALNNKNVQIL